MIKREDILSIEFLKKTEYTGSHQGMRYRLEKAAEGEETVLKVIVWPEPFGFGATPEEKKQARSFSFSEDGIVDGIAWMNDRLFEDRNIWESAHV